MKKNLIFSATYASATGWGVIATLGAYAIASMFFTDSMLLATTGLTSIALIFEMNHLLDENRDAIWIHRRSAWEANIILICKVIAIFVGVFFTSLALQSFWPRYFFFPLGLKEQFFSSEPSSLYVHNLRVLTASFLMAFIYRSAGVLLVVCWNAVNWSTALLTFIHSATAAGTKHAAFYALAVMPHLVLETAAYISSGMSGVFMSKALFKYKLSSGKFFRVSRASVAILGLSIGVLWVAMQLEIGLAQSVLKELRH